MAKYWLDLSGPVLASTVYADGVLVASDCTVQLPNPTFLTAEYKASGTMTLPLLGLIEHMEATITKIGIDNGLLKSCTPVPHDYELRLAMDVRDQDLRSAPKGVKAFMRATPMSFPGLSIETGNNIETEISLGVTRFRLTVGDEEYVVFDRINKVFVFDGRDYAQDLREML